MIERSILIFPKFNNMEEINELRKKYDPLRDNVPPHITLVFPFASDIEKDELKRHVINSIKGIKPFPIRLQGISGEEGNFLFLNVQEGKNEFVELHNKLYTKILKKYFPEFLTKVDYLPHLTVGRIADNEEFTQAIEDTKNFNYSFETIVDKISVEIIAENDDSIIEFELRL